MIRRSNCTLLHCTLLHCITYSNTFTAIHHSILFHSMPLPFPLHWPEHDSSLSGYALPNLQPPNSITTVLHLLFEWRDFCSQNLGIWSCRGSGGWHWGLGVRPGARVVRRGQRLRAPWLRGLRLRLRSSLCLGCLYSHLSYFVSTVPFAPAVRAIASTMTAFIRILGTGGCVFLSITRAVPRLLSSGSCSLHHCRIIEGGEEDKKC